jgi:hypothetical protein
VESHQQSPTLVLIVPLDRAPFVEARVEGSRLCNTVPRYSHVGAEGLRPPGELTSKGAKGVVVRGYSAANTIQL